LTGPLGFKPIPPLYGSVYTEGEVKRRKVRIVDDENKHLFTLLVDDAYNNLRISLFRARYKQSLIRHWWSVLLRECWQ